MGREPGRVGRREHRRIVRCYSVGNYKNGVMDATIEETDLINRARLDSMGPADGFDL